jgi:threonyl-tRNA synthetase
LLGYSTTIDNSGDKLDKKIRNAQLANYNFIGVIGK